MSDKPVKGVKSASAIKYDLAIGDEIKSVSIGELEANYNDTIAEMWESHRSLMEEWEKNHQKRIQEAAIFHKKASDKLKTLLDDAGIEVSEEEYGDYAAFFNNMSNFTNIEDAEGFADLLFTAICSGYDKLYSTELSKHLYPDHKISSDGYIYVKK